MTSQSAGYRGGEASQASPNDEYLYSGAEARHLHIAPKSMRRMS